MRAKFVCHSVTKDSSGNEIVTLGAVYGKDGSDNAQWSKFTPCGQLSMTISNPAAQGMIQPGKEYFLNITAAESTEATTTKPE